MKPTLFVALYHASVALHVPIPINEIQKTNTLFKQSSISEENMISISSAGENRDIFEEDIILDIAQRRSIDYNNYNDIDGWDRHLVSVWPTKEIPYVILYEHFYDDQIQAIGEAIEEINSVSCLNFHEITEYYTENVVVIKGDGSGCYSNIGYLNTGQVINLSNKDDAGTGCFRHGSVLHEILHTLGFHHTQARFDRDDYIDIIWDNIKEDQSYGFLKQITPRGIDLVTNYDYNSCMHYGRKAFSKNGGDTIVPKMADLIIGQRKGLSQGDIERLNLLYCK